MNSAAEPNPQFELDSPEAFANFFLRTPREIQQYLGLLLSKGGLINAHLDNELRSFITILLDIEPTHQALFFDPPQDTNLLAVATQAKSITFEALLDRIKIQFRLPKLTAEQRQSRLVLRGEIPSLLLRLQRREFFRLDLPHNTPVRCAISLGDQPHNFLVADLSGGGVGLLLPESESHLLTVGSTLQRCRLSIADEGVVIIDIRVLKTTPVSDSLGNRLLRIGCEFVNLPMSRQAMIERFITRMERERKAKETGLIS